MAARNKFGRRHSLVKQASLDRIQLEGIKRRNTIRHRKQLEKSILCKQLLQRLSDDSIELIHDLKDDGQIEELSLIVNSGRDSREIFICLMQKLLPVATIDHIETRPDCVKIGELEFLMKIRCQKDDILEVLSKLTIEKPVERIVIRKEIVAATKIWHPEHVSDLDQCAHVVVKYEPTEDPKHPGYGDQTYIERRAELNAIANSYRYGDPMPHIEYTDEEHSTWRQAYLKLKELRPTHTCREYQENIRQMEAAGLITAEKIPQLKDLNAYIQKRTGFQLRPCGGLLSARDFLASLAFRTFQATLYVRHASKPDHCPEPDVIHEILGHCPMFADKNMAQLSQEIGLLSLGASDEQIERLSTVYWYIIEFGLCREEDNHYRAIGAGLISAYGELQHACSDVPEHLEFEPKVAAVRPYEDSDYQPVYFVAESIFDAMKKLRTYAREIPSLRRFTYDSFTQTVSEMSGKEGVQQQMEELTNRAQMLKDELTDTNIDRRFELR